MRLTAYWNADDGQADFSYKEVKKLFAEHPVVTADFLQDVVSDSTSLYELARKGLFETQDERRRMLSKWMMYSDQVASIARGKALMEPAPEPANQWSGPDPYRVISWRDYPPSGVKVWPAVVLLLVAIALFVWFAGYL